MPSQVPPLRAADPVHQALGEWMSRCTALGWSAQTPRVLVPLTGARGRVCAEPILTLRASPPFDAAAMDGIAVTIGDRDRVRECRAGTGTGTGAGAGAATGGSPGPQSGTRMLEPGDYDVIDTGDPLPTGRNTVVQLEAVQWQEQDGVRHAVVPDDIPLGRHVRRAGEDLEQGAPVIPFGRRLGPFELAAAAAAGHAELVVHRAPRVAVMASGDELRPVGVRLEPGQITDTNSLMLAEQARQLGAEVSPPAIVPDRREALATAVRAAAAQADLVIISAGAGPGRDDHTAAVLAQVGEVVRRGLPIRPGHPVLLGVVDAVPVLGCPGYPVAAALCFDLFAAPLLAALESTTAPSRTGIRARLSHDVDSPAQVQEWVRVRMEPDAGAPPGSRPLATLLPRGAGALSSMVRADGLVRVPIGVARLAAGTEVTVLPLR